MNNIGMRRLLQILLLSALVLVSMTQRADATFHIMVIAELYPGSYANPDAQYVMLQSLASFQNQIGGKAIITFNPDGTRGPDFGTFAANSTNTASGAHYLMTTSAAQTFFGFTRADGTASGRMPFPSGRICFVDPVFGTVVDCVAYGAYTGSNIGYGAPAAGLVSQKISPRGPPTRSTASETPAPTETATASRTSVTARPVTAACTSCRSKRRTWSSLARLGRPAS